MGCFGKATAWSWLATLGLLALGASCGREYSDKPSEPRESGDGGADVVPSDAGAGIVAGHGGADLGAQSAGGYGGADEMQAGQSGAGVPPGGRPSVGGATGADAAGGGAAGYDDIGWAGGPGETVTVQHCTIGGNLPLNQPVGLAVSATYAWAQPQLYSFDSATDTMVVKWMNSLATWTQWICFDLLPGVRRIAAMNLAGSEPEIFAVTNEGYLFARRYHSTWGWTPWLFFSPPSGTSFLTDVTAVGGPWAHVLIADGERIHVNRQQGPSSDDGFSPWRALRVNGASMVAATRLEGTAVQIFSSTDDGLLQTLTLNDEKNPKEEWLPLPALHSPPIDLEAGKHFGDARLFALDGAGSVRMLSDSVWTQISWAGSPFVAIAVHSLPAGAAMLYGVTADGRASVHDGGDWAEVAWP
jgi:hypothetical protein